MISYSASTWVAVPLLLALSLFCIAHAVLDNQAPNRWLTCLRRCSSHPSPPPKMEIGGRVDCPDWARPISPPTRQASAPVSPHAESPLRRITCLFWPFPVPSPSPGSRPERPVEWKSLMTLTSPLRCRIASPTPTHCRPSRLALLVPRSQSSVSLLIPGSS